MQYSTTAVNPSSRSVDCLIVGIYEGGTLSSGANDVDQASRGKIKRLLKSGDLTPKLGQCMVLTDVTGVRAPRVVVVGLGKQNAFKAKQFQAAILAALRAISGSKCKSVLNCLTLEAITGSSEYYLARYTAQAAATALYRFTQLKSDKKPAASALRRIEVALPSRGGAGKAMRGFEHGDAIGFGMSLARELGNLPSNICTPSYLARSAQKLARDSKLLQTRVLNEAEMKRLGMHSLLSVSAGSQEPGKLIVMQYKGGGRQKPVVLVGKGVTFDTGGISLKPGAAMDEMKFDMCGAAGVLGTMATVARLQLPINLNVIVPTVENMPSGTATNPGDIVTSMSGQTIEILNTDAEGRLILCDALTYSRRFKPDTVIDVATLTGACVIALGHHRTGVMSKSDALAASLVAAGELAGDYAWRLPLDDEYAEQLQSNFADMANVGGREGGAITAGCFLAKFTDGLNWAHLDVAGTAWSSGKQKGASGRPVPLLTEFLLARSGALP
ncbi:MAG: leucyl aminopeptidase [Gammaproteobacteria bacterium]|nr:leucyl aminopeptidase [Gammaproteobacteria bacterium]MDH5303850.1 leucyl aminopeptidase [Gammaproteobacteria bacterium]MDH5323187.1 leucyl aminopeptidase [Gammaproteobacteria bacterium]